MEQFDFIIVGGGIAGTSLGAALAPHGRLLLVEAEAQCGYHATGRSAAFWHEGYGGPGVAPLSRASRAFLDRPPASFAEQSFLTPRGALHIARDRNDFDIVEGIAIQPIDRAALEQRLPGIRPEWRFGLWEEGLADIDVAGLHAAYLREVRQKGAVRIDARLAHAEWATSGWTLGLRDGSSVSGRIVVNAAGAWADSVAQLCGVGPLGIRPKRRTMVQLRVGRTGIARLPLIVGAAGDFYFKGEGDQSLWLSPHDELETDPCDAAPEEIDIAVAIDRFEQVVDWPVERVERSWAGLRSFAPDRLPVFGFDAEVPDFFWCAGQGGFGIQTAPAAASLCAALLLGTAPDPMVTAIDPSPYAPSRFAAAPA